MPDTNWTGSINWAGWSFALLIVAGFLYLLRLNNDTSKFRLVDLITDSEGRGYSPSFTYTSCFILGAWMCWYLAVSAQYTEASATFAVMMAGYVTGSVLRGNTAAKERTAALNVSSQPKQGD